MKKVLLLAVVFGLVVTGFGDLTVVRTIPVGGDAGLNGSAWSIGNGFISEGPNGVERLDQTEWFDTKGTAYMAFLDWSHCDTETYIVSAAGDSGVSFTNNLYYNAAFPIPGGAKDIAPFNGSAIAAGDSGIYWIGYGCLGKEPKILWKTSLSLTERVVVRQDLSHEVTWLFALSNAGYDGGMISVYHNYWINCNCSGSHSMKWI